MDTYKHLTLAERVELKIGLTRGESLRQIARNLGRSASTLSRERKRVMEACPAYDADEGLARALRLRQRPGRKLAQDTPLWEPVLQRLRCGWSPEQIAGQLRLAHETGQRVSHETIYRALYALPKGDLKKELLSLLRHAGRARRPRSAGKKRGEILKDITPIAARPAEVDDRIIPGHWEADLIKGKGNKSAVATIVERTTRFTLLAQMPDASAASTLDAITKAMQSLPTTMRKTLTYDRGSEMARHAQLAKNLHIDIYFADPYAPWQRGTNENTNGLIRQYLPKGIDLSPATQDYLNDIAMSLNTRPRKALGFLTPLEKYNQLLEAHSHPNTVALQG
jgi:transposase, IS30 family